MRGEGPGGGGAGPHQGWGCREAGASAAGSGERSRFPQPRPSSAGRERPPRQCIPVSRPQVDRAAGGSWGAAWLRATVPQLHAGLGGGDLLHHVVQYYPPLTDDSNTDILEVAHTATQQGTWSPRKERVASSRPAFPNPRGQPPSECGLTFCIPTTTLPPRNPCYLEH